ncbi:Universal stress protein F [Afipia felis]|uniref:Universal stress protein F n=1 Tax=Afipia felis TaxID=1035 RepID=A0A090MV86_AFIFE|nr:MULTISPECIES: universal stress protein [Afipia]EFI49986.1 UspA domain protein [Afipia sp. 1NLS2]MBE0703088.1 universal stress protein [Afipia sp.]RTL74099.1 MAG: universal stress protein [Bradyrhizobiaceae bacterium]CEG09819.1 Universal stress protein F [Afipia felis]
MYTHILIPTDGSELAQRGVDHGLSLAKALGSNVTIITASAPFPLPVSRISWGIKHDDIDRYAANCRTEAEDLLAKIKATATKMGISATTTYVPDTSPATAILETAKQATCNLIVMASHGRRGVERLLLGSQAAEVVSNSPIPVLIVP